MIIYVAAVKQKIILRNVDGGQLADGSSKMSQKELVVVSDYEQYMYCIVHAPSFFWRIIKEPKHLTSYYSYLLSK